MNKLLLATAMLCLSSTAHAQATQIKCEDIRAVVSMIGEQKAIELINSYHVAPKVRETFLRCLHGGK